MSVFLGSPCKQFWQSPCRQRRTWEPGRIPKLFRLMEWGDMPTEEVPVPPDAGLGSGTLPELIAHTPPYQIADATTTINGASNTNYGYVYEVRPDGALNTSYTNPHTMWAVEKRVAHWTSSMDWSRAGIGNARIVGPVTGTLCQYLISSVLLGPSTISIPSGYAYHELGRGISLAFSPSGTPTYSTEDGGTKAFAVFWFGMEPSDFPWYS